MIKVVRYLKSIEFKKFDVTDFELRKFASIFAILLFLWASWVYFNTKSISIWSLILASMLLIFATLKPKFLIFWYNLWMNIGYALVWFNTNISLIFMYFVLLTPIGLFRRMFGKNGLQPRKLSNLDSYAVPSHQRSPDHFNRMF